MTAAAKAAPTRSIDDILRDDYEYTTDLTSAGRYMPLLRRSARALVRYKDKLNAARQRVLQVLVVHTCTSPRPHDCLLWEGNAHAYAQWKKRGREALLYAHMPTYT
jgi:hypothetical protein